MLTLRDKVLPSSTQAIKFLCEQNPLGTVLFLLFRTAVHIILVSIFVVFEMMQMGLVMISWLCFQMDMSNFPHVTITEDGRLCSMGHHHSGFPRVLYDALHLGYNGDILVDRARMSVAHSTEQCEVSVNIPLSSEEPWMATVIGIKLDNTVDQMAQVALTLLGGSHLADTAVMPIALFLIRYQGDPLW
jgi:hypothetical protein